MTLPEVTWDTLDWAALERLRAGFLAGDGAAGAYWQSAADVAAYDLTFAQRIAWKWEAVLAELRARGWTPPGGVVLDWGCGSGVASRCVLREWGAEQFSALQLFDRSSVAMEFAATRAKKLFPVLPVEVGAPSSERLGLLLVSHVLNELPAADRDALLQLAARAEAVLWVEPGSHADSRALGAVRERLRGTFNVVAPCVHADACGVLAPGCERHWCHNFAAPPPGLLAQAHWAEFARRLGIDLLRVPYAFLALERKGRVRPAAWESGERIVGEPRLYKGFAKVFCCGTAGVRDLTLQKRDAPALFKRLKDEDRVLLLRGESAGEKLTNVTATLP